MAPKNIAPMQKIDGDATEDRAGCHSEEYPHRVYRHGIAAPVCRKYLKRNDHDEGLDNTGRHSLKNSTDNDHVESLAKPSDNAPQRENGSRWQEADALAKGATSQAFSN